MTDSSESRNHKATPSAWAFFGWAIAWFVVLTVIWLQLAAWAAYPATWVARAALAVGAPQWAQKVSHQPGVLTVDTPFAAVSAAGPSGRPVVKPISVDMETAALTYGMPLLLALFITAGRSGWQLRVLPAMGVLWVAQGLCMALAVLGRITKVVGNAQTLGVEPWQVDALNVMYFQSMVLMPTLAPVMIWLWLDWPFMARLWGRADPGDEAGESLGN